MFITLAPGVHNVLPAIQQLNTFQNSVTEGYSAVFSSPWAPHIDIEEKHYEITTAINRWARTGDRKLDKFQMVLLTIIILLSCEDTGFVGEQKSRIEKLQMKYIIMYQRYLKHACPKEAKAKFVGGLMLLHHSKELFNLNSMRLPF